jgi:hypothetical protein
MNMPGPTGCYSTYVSLSLSLSLVLLPTVSRLVCLGIKHPSWACGQVFITVRQLRVCWCGVFSLTRESVCHLQLPLAFDSAVILGSESLGIREHILLSQIQDFPFRRLLWLSGLRWSTHICGTRIEREVEIDAINLANKPSPRTPMNIIQWRICENL